MNFLDGLNPRQREAVEHAEGPLLILAGAGSGKTRVITHRIAHLMTACAVPGWAILAVTFTNKAAGEMRDRVKSLVPTAPQDAATVATFHSFCVRLLRREGAPLAATRRGFTQQFTIYDDDDQIAMLKGIYKSLGLDDKFMQYRAALSRISSAKSKNDRPEDIARAATDPVTTKFATIYERYENKLRESNALDFDDLLLEAVNLLRHDEPTRIRMNQRYEFVMVDEYQDTNRSQYDLMRLLTGERRNICVVGDEDQSIYSWRGANIRNILDFERDFPGAITIRLEQNYRSTQNILEAAGAVVANNTERIGKDLWTESGAGEKITLYEAPDSENEALWIADTIEKRLTQNPAERVAVLYRTNSQSRQIEEALRRYNRKYVVVGGFSFYQRSEVKDLLAYLKVLVSQQDSISLLRVINTPARGIGRTTLDQVEQYALHNGLAVWDALEKMLDENAFSGRAESALSAFRRLIAELKEELETRPLSDTLAAVLERTGYRKMLEDEGSEDAKTRLANLEELVNASADASERGETLRDFLDHAALVSDADSADARAPVSLLTMHNAKGLEFPVVFVAGLEEGLFPHSRSLDSEAAMEEERRLCYVGMTRAEKKLYLTWARFRRRFGGGAPEASISSRFLQEAPKNLLDVVKGTATTRSFGGGYGNNYSYGNGYGSSAYGNTSYGSSRPNNSGSSSPGSSGYAYPAKTPPANTPAARTPDAAPPGSMDLFSERSEVKETAQRNLYTGKTYNSVDNIRQFFSDKAPQAPVNQPVSGPPSTPAALPQKKAGTRKLGPGSSVDHAKYGRGTVVRMEGSGDDTKVTVSFPGHGLKKLIAKYAGIKLD